MKKLTLLLLSVILFSCAEKGPEKPEHLLSEEQMENILHDMALLQTLSSVNPQEIQQNGIDVHNYIYNKYGIDSLTLVQNQRFYASDIQKYQNIHKNVTERLKAAKKPLDSIKNKPSGRKFRQAGATLSVQ